jgi:hypothetical protein
MRTEPDNLDTDTYHRPARSRQGQYCAILASLQAVRPRCAAGAAPGPRLRVPHAHNMPETTRKRSQQPNPALPSSAASGMTPSDWQRSRVRFSAQVNDGCGGRHRPARGVRLLYFSAVHVKTITSNRIDHFVSLLGMDLERVFLGSGCRAISCKWCFFITRLQNRGSLGTSTEGEQRTISAGSLWLASFEQFDDPPPAAVLLH